MKRIMLSVAASALAVGVGLASEVPLAVQTAPVLSVDVPAESEQTLAVDARIPEKATVSKSGAGTLVVPASAVRLAPLDVQVREGSARYENDLSSQGDLPETTDPNDLSEAVKAKLAFWGSVKDPAHLVTEDGGAGVERWYDVRETDMANPTFVYLQALRTDGKPAPERRTAQYVRKYRTETNELETVWFGGPGSGRAMQFLNADGSAMMTRPRETSVVYGYLYTSYDASGAVTAQFGTLFGNCMATTEHQLWNEPDALPWCSVWGPAAGDTALWIDGGAYARGQDLPHGFHVLHARYNSITAAVNQEPLKIFENALFSTSEKTGGRGGQDVSEVLFFKDRLTDGERREVQDYLYRKWFARRSTARVALAAGTSLEVDVAADTETDLQVTGTGSFVKKGEGTLVYRPQSGTAEPAAPLTVEGGAVETRRAVTLSVAAGQKIDSALAMNAPQVVSVGVAAADDAIEKTGLGFAAIAAVPEATKTVHVKAGTLAFRPTKAFEPRYEVAIPNGDFSDWGGDTTHANIAAEHGGWNKSGSVGFYNYDRWMAGAAGTIYGATVTISAYGFDKIPPPAGRDVLMMKQCNCKAWVNVSFAEPGEYELSYMVCGRSNSANTWLKNYLKDEAGGTLDIGISALTDLKNWTPRAFRFTVAKAGTYTLYFEQPSWKDSKGTENDFTVLVNSLHLYRVGGQAVVWKIPNGDFDLLNTNHAARAEILVMDGTAQTEGWTFDTRTEGTATVGGKAYSLVFAGLASPITYTEQGRRWGSGYNGTHEPLGNCQALIRRNGGWMQTVITPPAGTWYLKATAANWGEYAYNVEGPTLRATATADGAEAVDLGSVALPKTWMMTPRTWPKPFVCDGKTALTVKVWVEDTSGARGANLDDFELVGAYENDDELIKNGDFESLWLENGGQPPASGSKWTAVATAKGSLVIREYGRDDVPHFGTDHGSGDYFAEPYNNGTPGGLYQDVFFPKGGWYRLSYLAKTRANASPSGTAGAFDIQLIDVETSTTNLVASSDSLPAGHFAEYSSLLHVDEACTRRLLIIVQKSKYTAFDDISLRYVGEDVDAAFATPSDAAAEEKGFIVKIDSGAKLQLDFTGTNRVTRLVVHGVRQPAGVYGAANCPSIQGPGSLLVQPRYIGEMLIVRYLFRTSCRPTFALIGGMNMVTILLATVLSLNGEWNLDYFPQPAKGAVRTLAIPRHETVKAAVPGNCELDLVNAGILPPPEKGLNVLRLRPYEGYQWLYTKTFEAEPCDGEDGSRAELVFGGIDTLADVFLNGEKVGESSNMLIERRFDVTGRLRRGANTVQVLIRSAFLEAQRYTLGELGYHMGWGDNEPLRKAAHMGGWDIFPRVYCAGLWRDVSLETLPPVRVGNVAWIVGDVKTDGAGSSRGSAQVKVQFRVQGPMETFTAGNRALVTLTRGGKTALRLERPLNASQNSLRGSVVGAELWWPRGMGEPALYEAKVEILSPGGASLAANACKVGIREVKLEREDIYGPDRPGQFLFRVNGEPCYVRGSNWVPLDSFHGRDGGRLAETLEMFADLNCNMVRVWGGGVYEPDAFFDWCDAHGLMVWQDFMTGCSAFPQNDDYAKATEEEIRMVVLRFRNRASLVLWSGNNENDNAFRWGAIAGQRRDPNKDRNSRRTIPDVLFEYDVTRPYLPSSPYETKDVVSGRAQPSEMHLWGARAYYKVPFYTNSPCFFASEMGYHGCPNRATIERMMTAASVYPWKEITGRDPFGDYRWNDEWQLKASNPFLDPTSGLWRRNSLMTNQAKIMFGDVPTELDDFIAASQIIQAEAMKTFVERFRSEKFHGKNGLIWWNVRDGWPQISDAVVDYYGGKKRAYYAIRAVQHDQLVMLRDDHGAWAVNDRRHPVKGHAKFTDRASGKVLLECDYEVGANARTSLGSVAFAGQGLVDIVYEADGERHANWFLYGEPPFDWAKVKSWFAKDIGEGSGATEEK